MADGNVDGTIFIRTGVMNSVLLDKRYGMIIKHNRGIKKHNRVIKT